MTTGAIFEDGKTGVLKFDHSAVQGETYWKAMEGDAEKEKTFSKKKKNLSSSGEDKHIHGWRPSQKRGHKNEPETVTRNIMASGAGGEDFEHFMRTIAKGSATEIVSAAEPPFCKCKGPVWQDAAAICWCFKLCGCARRARTLLDSCQLSRLCIDCASRIKCA